MAIETTLSIIKPDAVAKNVIGQIYARFEAAGLKIVAAKMVHLSRVEAEALFAKVTRGDWTPADAELFRAQMLTEMAAMSVVSAISRAATAMESATLVRLSVPREPSMMMR